MHYLRISIFFIVIAIYAIIVSALGFVFCVFGQKNIVYKLGKNWAKLFVQAFSFIFNVTVSVSGKENVPKGPCLIASKHESVWETIFLFSYLENVVFILKKQLFYIPFFGQYIKILGMIAIDRSLGVRALRKAVDESRKSFRSGNKVLIFPEGTRVKRGEVVQLKSGVYMVYKNSPEIPVISVNLDSGKVWPTKTIAIKSGVINVRFRKIEHLDDDISKRDFLDKVGQSINSTSKA